MEERDYYGRRRHPRERFEDDRRTRADEDQDLRYAPRPGAGRTFGPWWEESYGYVPDEPRYARRFEERRELWGMREGPYDAERQYYGDEPYGPAHSPAHMRGAGRPVSGWERPPVESWRPPSDEPAYGRERAFGGYAGRGPKGYRRSRERILDDVSERLMRHPEIDASEIEVDVQEDVVVLRGRVYDRRQKRLAEDVAESVSGVRDVRNELDVEKGILETLTDAVTGRSEEEARTETYRTSV